MAASALPSIVLENVCNNVCLQCEARRIGEDILIAVWGGERPHIGSVAIAVPRKSMKNSRNTSATSSVFNRTGHKDEVLARRFAEQVAISAHAVCVVTAGIHVENISEKMIFEIEKSADRLCTQLVLQIREQW